MKVDARLGGKDASYWKTVAAHVPGRAARECQSRWFQARGMCVYVMGVDAHTHQQQTTTI